MATADNRAALTFVQVFTFTDGTGQTFRWHVGRAQAEARTPERLAHVPVAEVLAHTDSDGIDIDYARRLSVPPEPGIAVPCNDGWVVIDGHHRAYALWLADPSALFPVRCLSPEAARRCAL